MEFKLSPVFLGLWMAPVTLDGRIIDANASGDDDRSREGEREREREKYFELRKAVQV